MTLFYLSHRKLRRGGSFQDLWEFSSETEEDFFHIRTLKNGVFSDEANEEFNFSDILFKKMFRI